jgi:hypothetical protein
MPVFKGFEKNELDQPVAVVDYPNATKHSFMQDAQGALRRVTVPNPHEERLNEATFAKRHGVGFEPLKALPYNEDGYDLATVLADNGPKAPTPGLDLGIKNGM